MNFIYLNKILLENLFLKFKLMSKITQDPDPGSEQKLSEKSDPDTDPKKSFRIHNTVKNSEQFQKCIQKAQRRHGGKRLGWHRDENHSGSRDILRDPTWVIGRKSTRTRNRIKQNHGQEIAKLELLFITALRNRTRNQNSTNSNFLPKRNRNRNKLESQRMR
jgi:hypothetical protein